MVRLLFFCLVLLSFGGNAWAENGCELRQVLSIESKVDRGRHLLVPVTMMERETHLLLDTGGAWSMMNESAELVDLRGGVGQLILGMNELRYLHLYIATKEKMIYVTAADTRREDVAVMGLSAPTRTRARLSKDGPAP